MIESRSLVGCRPKLFKHSIVLGSQVFISREAMTFYKTVARTLIANPIYNKPGAVIVMNGYSIIIQQNYSQTPHPSASNIAGTAIVAIAPMPTYTTTFVRTSTHHQTRKHNNE